jgi:hypothetical protein
VASGDLEIRVRAARTAIQDERSRFSASDAGRMQWNWYVRQLAADIGLERHRLARSIHKPARPGKPTPAPMLTLLDSDNFVDVFPRSTPHMMYSQFRYNAVAPE